jgi:hypothetical protein
MSLPEVLIAVTVLGLIVGTLAMVSSVILRQLDNTQGRTNNARSEQNVSIWMPTDLSSAETVDTTAGAVPCGPIPACPPSANIGGSNALQLSWTGSIANSSTGGVALPTLTVVGYRVVEVNGEFQLIRVHCYSINGAAATCDTQVVLHDLDPPPPTPPWVPGMTSPTWVLTVSNALAAADTSGPSATVADPGLDAKNARRVVVTINGGGDVAGAGGGQNQISLSAGGTERQYNLTTDDLSGAPTFTASRSRCGGNYGVIVDTSGSIGSTDMGTVRNGVNAFIDTFTGTPVKIEVVTFSTISNTLGAGAGWSKYYDMLIDTDVTALKGLVGGMVSSGSTNWEDGFFRMLKNSDGSVQAQLPSTILFFTDGIPNRSRIDGSSGSAAAVADPLDAGYTSSGSGFSQTAWNRAERLVRDRGSIDLVGIYVNTDVTATSTWTIAGAGYHTDYQRADAVIYEHSSTIYEVGNTVVWERGSHTTYEKNNAVTLQYANAGISWERLSGGSWVSAKSGTLATSTGARDKYFQNNTSPGEADGWRARVASVGALGSWTTVPSLPSSTVDYDNSNLTTDSSDGFRSSYGTPSGSWTSVSLAQYTSSNTTPSDGNDGWRMTVFNTSPFTDWTSVSQSAYDIGNTNTGTSDGWRTRTTGAATTWASATSAQYTGSNTTSDSTDGWRTSTAWTPTTQALYDLGNTTTSSSDGWRTSVSGTITTWTTLTQALYNASNTTSDSTDGWRSTKTYTPPFTSFDGASTFPISDFAAIGNLVVGNVSGIAGNFVEALPRGGPYTNAAAADLFVLPNYANFGSALSTIALGQCGGTVTLQTKTGSTAAQDPFIYENASSVNHEVVTTSAAYRSGTFDVALPGGSAQAITITPQDFTSLARYNPVGWSCKAGGVAYPFTVVPIVGHAPWSSIQLSVTANKAISCVQSVALK